MFDTSKSNKKKTYGIVATFIVFLTLVVYFVGLIWFEEASVSLAIGAMIFSVISAWGSYYF